MSLASLFAIVMLNLVGAASPGPDVVLVTRMATRSRRHAIATSIGTHVGATVWVSLTVFGAAAILTTFPQALGIIQVVGGAWLMIMGQSTVRGGLMTRKYPPKDLAELEAQLGSPWRSFRRGLATNLSNPKIVIFLAALVAPALPPEPSVGTALLVIASLVFSSLLLFLTMSTLVSTRRVRQALLRSSWLIDVLAGTFFVIAGLVLIIHGGLG
ncbi:LysE family translocator [Corynebacterium tapiri]|uniref:LysE family translocator n=1 Tax=Corynebacterium tapiri TaxID=1448266 RepID=A0A5C4U415_9CORY|nr:LysE family translocator [Corynebacterium tapiri]TNL96623.1 LysE family translocator [Corynebacterium tapiri]